MQGSTLRHAHMPGACTGRSCPRVHKLLRLCARLGKWFLDWACIYFPSSIHKLYRACINIGWERENFCTARKFLEPRARWVCKPNAQCQALKCFCFKHESSNILTHWHLGDLNKILDVIFKPILVIGWVGCLLRNCPQMNAKGRHQW